MSNLSLRNKLLLLAILPLSLLLISLMASSYYLESQNQQQNFETIKSKLIKDKHTLLATEVEIASKLVRHQLDNGSTQSVKNVLRELTFGDDG